MNTLFRPVGQAAAIVRATQQAKKANDVLYVLYSPATNLIKVGRASDFKQRKLSLERAQRMKLDTLATYGQKGVYEKVIHEMRAEYQADGPGKEWFSRAASTILDMINTCIAELPAQRSLCTPKSVTKSPCQRLHQTKRPAPDMSEIARRSKRQSLSEEPRRARARIQELTTTYHLADAINSPSLAEIRAESQNAMDELLAQEAAWSNAV